MILDNYAYEQGKTRDKVPVCCDFCKTVLAPRQKREIKRGLKKSPFHCCMKGFCQSRLQIATGKKQPITVTNHELVAEWHPTKNGDITPDMVTAGCHEMVWWLDVHGHEWDATVNSRTSGGNGCPECLDMVKINREKKERQIASGEKLPISVTDQEVAAQWHPTKNMHLKRANGIDVLTAEWITAGSEEIIWWLCPEDPNHEWETWVYSRTNGKGCPHCVDRSKINRETIERQIASGEKLPISVTDPEIAAQWHPTKNMHLKRANGIDTLTPEWVLARSGEKVWWFDVHGHEWDATVANRTSGRGCPKCAEYGFTPQDKAVVYLLQQPDKMKIGITNLYGDVLENSRIKKHQRNGWNLIDHIEFDIGQDAYDLEQSILARLDANKIRRGFSAFLEFFDGYTECWRAADYCPQSIAEIIAVVPSS